MRVHTSGTVKIMPPHDAIKSRVERKISMYRHPLILGVRPKARMS